MKTLKIVDTTLRDGEQAPGVAFRPEEKLYIARMLDLMGVDVIEAGTPAMGEDEQKAIASIKSLGLKALINTWNRMLVCDVNASLACGVKDIHLSAPVSDIHINYKLLKSRKWVLDCTRRTIEYAVNCGCNVTVGAEDASRADPAFLEEFALVCRESGARRLRYADTVGVMEPFGVYERLSRLIFASGMEIEYHGHNDFGLATANALAAVRAGVVYVNTTVGGMGERAGNTDFRGFIRGVIHIFNVTPVQRLNLLPKLENYVAAAAGRAFPGGFMPLGEQSICHQWKH